MTSLVDSPEIGNRLAQLRGKRSSGRVFEFAGQALGSTMYRQLDADCQHWVVREVTPPSMGGHRFQDGRKCIACGMDRSSFAIWGKPCASASMPLIPHDLDPVTGNCLACHATREAIEDALVPADVCRCAGERPTFHVPDCSPEDAIARRLAGAFPLPRARSEQSKLSGKDASLIIVDDPAAECAEGDRASAASWFLRVLERRLVPDASDGVALRSMAHPTSGPAYEDECDCEICTRQPSASAIEEVWVDLGERGA